MISPAESVVIRELPTEHIALVTINRPDKKNAVNGQVTRELASAIAWVESTRTVRVAVLAGAPCGVFCAGADLTAITAGAAHELSTPDGGFAGFVNARRSKPWIAALHGKVLGGGLELALACDLRICSNDSWFGLPEVTRGIIAGAGGVTRLPATIAPALALEMILTGTPISAVRAHEIGLVNAVVPDRDTVSSALEFARVIASNSPIAVRESLRLARFASLERDAQCQPEVDLAIERIFASSDFREGPLAFVERRAPQWADV